MNNNLYWSIYKNLEDEFKNLSNLIHIDDGQLKIYSIKISELLIRAAVEVESIAKELYYSIGGSKPDDKDLFFDTDCIDLLEEKWELSKKKVLVSASNLYLSTEANTILTPLRKANKRGTSSSDWLKAYQAIKHNRGKNLKKGNLKHLLGSMAGLYLLNIYYKDLVYNLEKDGTGTNFDNRLGSDLFSIKTHINQNISIDVDFSKNPDFEECVYIVRPTDETRVIVQNSLKAVMDKANKKISENLTSEIQKKLSEIEIDDGIELNEKLNEFVDKTKTEFMHQVTRENASAIKKSSDGLRYEAILNKNQY